MEDAVSFKKKKKDKKKEKRQKQKKKKKKECKDTLVYHILLHRFFFVVGFISGGLSEIFMRDELRESSLRRVLFISYDFPIGV